jgi:pyrroloquinoline quinone biosynthesis protein B
MGHAPISGVGGTLATLAELRSAKPSGSSGRVLYIHVNNTNPVLDAGSEAAALVRRAGIEIAMDGMELAV